MLRRVQKRKERRNKILMGLVLAFLMIFSLAGVILGNNQGGDYEYNGFKFKQENNFFTLKVEKQEYRVNYLPQQILNIPVSKSLDKALNSPMLYFSFNPNVEDMELTYMDAVRNEMQKDFDKLIVQGISQESDVYMLPSVSCENSTESTPVLYFNVSDETAIREKNSCIVLNGRNVEFFKLRDLILYRYLGVMNAGEESQGNQSQN